MKTVEKTELRKRRAENGKSRISKSIVPGRNRQKREQDCRRSLERGGQACCWKDPADCLGSDPFYGSIMQDEGARV
jgi:hypothetical protein